MEKIALDKVFVLRLSGDEIMPDDADVFDDMDSLLEHAKTRISYRKETAMEFDDYDEGEWDVDGLMETLEWDGDVELPDGSTLTIEEGEYHRKNK